MAELVEERVDPAEKAEFLEALARKGEAPEEVVAFVLELRKRAVPVPIPPEIRQAGLLDIVGTGGDHVGTLNVSTAVALICAAAGISVAKHGNRAVTSSCGSADVLEALGIRIDLEPEQAVESIIRYGFAFFFAPKYHPAFKHVAAARKLCAQKQLRTIFNFVGPLLNPAYPTEMLVGVSSVDLCMVAARVLRATGVRRAMVVCGSIPTPQGQWRIDEISTLGRTDTVSFEEGGNLVLSMLDPTELPVRRVPVEELRGGDARTNARLLEDILLGRDTGPRWDLVRLNAAAALTIARRATNLVDGWCLAQEVVRSGAAGQKLDQLRNAFR